MADAKMILKEALGIFAEYEKSSADPTDTIPSVEKTFSVRSVTEYNGRISLLLEDADHALCLLSVTDDIVITKDSDKVSVEEILVNGKVAVEVKEILETYPARLQGTTYIKIIE